jgi:hypothetical protein
MTLGRIMSETYQVVTSHDKKKPEPMDVISGGIWKYTESFWQITLLQHHSFSINATL